MLRVASVFAAADYAAHPGVARGQGLWKDLRGEKGTSAHERVAEDVLQDEALIQRVKSETEQKHTREITHAMDRPHSMINNSYQQALKHDRPPSRSR